MTASQKAQFDATDSVDFLPILKEGPSAGRMRACGDEGLRETQGYTQQYAEAVHGYWSTTTEDPMDVMLQSVVWTDGELINWND